MALVANTEFLQYGRGVRLIVTLLASQDSSMPLRMAFGAVHGRVFGVALLQCDKGNSVATDTRLIGGILRIRHLKCLMG
jgi:hypothetical protein